MRMHLAGRSPAQQNQQEPQGRQQPAEEQRHSLPTPNMVSPS